MSLKNLREELGKVNKELFKALDSRQQVVAEIQNYKENDKSLWDAARELNVFQCYLKDYPNSNTEDDFLFSFIIEKQASSIGNYPKWSNGEHLQSLPNSIIEMTNPVLIYIKDREKLNELDLKEKFKVDKWEI